MTLTVKEARAALKQRSAAGRPTSNGAAKERNKEQQRRYQSARGTALTALARIHHEDYVVLYREAMSQVVAARGPLPGDE